MVVIYGVSSTVYDAKTIKTFKLTFTLLEVIYFTMLHVCVVVYITNNTLSSSYEYYINVSRALVI